MPMHYAEAHCTQTKSTDENGKEWITFTGPYFGETEIHSVKVTAAALNKYRQGSTIQAAFPDLSVDDREFLMSGMSPKKWNDTFAMEDDDDEDSTEAEERRRQTSKFSPPPDDDEDDSNESDFEPEPEEI
jgi:hypothetical protein